MDSQYKVIESKVRDEKIRNIAFSHTLGYALISSITAPLTTLGVTLQLSSKTLEKYYEQKTTEITKLELAKSFDLAVKERRLNEVQLASGMVGANKPFRAPFYLNYRQAALALAGQGYQGFYKGNGVEILRVSCTLYPKYYILTSNYFEESPLLIKYMTAFSVELAEEYISQPFQNAHTRYILQNRIPEYRVYRSLFRLLSTLRPQELYQGSKVILPKRALYFVTLTEGNSDVSYNIAWLWGMLTLIYPLETVQRRLEAQSTEHSMLPRRYLDGIRWTLSRIYHEEGIRHGLYRGYICNTLANSVKIVLTPMLAYMFWHKNEQNQYLNERWDLVN